MPVLSKICLVSGQDLRKTLRGETKESAGNYFARTFKDIVSRDKVAIWRLAGIGVWLLSLSGSILH